MTNETVHDVRPNMKNLQFTFTKVDDEVTLMLNDEELRKIGLLGPLSSDKGPKTHEIKASELRSGENRLQVIASDTKGGYSSLIGKLVVEYDDGSQEVVTEWNRDAVTITKGETFIDETILLAYRSEIVHHVRHNVRSLRFTFTHVDNTVTVKLNDERPWTGELTIPNSRYDDGRRIYEIDALEPGENRIQVTANDTGGSAALIGKLTVEYDDGSKEVVTEWDYSQVQGPGDKFIDETIKLIYDDSTSATVTDVLLTFTQIDDRVEVFLNGSSEPTWSHPILRHKEKPATWSVSPLKAGMNKLEVKALNTAGSATLHGSVEFRYSDGRSVEAHSWALNAGHHVPRDPKPFEHFSIEFPH